MTDKQLRSISKTELLKLLHRQELEIERLNAENAKLSERAHSLENAGSLAEASLLVSGLMEAAQSAADIYLDSIQKVEAEKLGAIVKLEQEAKARALRENERMNAEAKARIERVVIDILRAFDNQVSKLAEMKEELTELMCENELSYLLPGNSRTKRLELVRSRDRSPESGDAVDGRRTEETPEDSDPEDNSPEQGPPEESSRDNMSAAEYPRDEDPDEEV